ncbi:carboxymuconolactone decarboxylase family protein [Microbacterium allomyrinae]|jgi:AhpD family alkylhydroperoxidase|uniref:Carboxymuconolactone decarboxylase family protein n=1 Tax=Microbacterium allomyrinae TaxID=2830666 RepID=A0A9X1LXE5_9MICO|nr:carboxymuconolactone decarboxylase family protein [Microbacterium allomyrinae]MCC2033498.1 carboxymuconolactone decarboxylase family protein [Microbacterium allomyrinae]
MTQEPRVHLSRSAPPAYQALSAFSKAVGAIATENGLDDRLKELVQIHTSQLNGCAYCVRVHVERAVKAGVTADVVAQLPVWRDSGVFTDRERAGLELAESFAFIHDDGIPDDVYDRVGGVLSEAEYVALSWILVSINAFNRVAIAGRYDVPPRDDLTREDKDAAAGKAW